MKKAYFLVPAIALVIFYFFYADARGHYKAEAEAAAQAAKDKFRAEQLQDAENRKIAIEAALAENAKRKAAREAKEAAELAKKEARQDAVDALDLARGERDRLRDKVRDLEGNIQTVKSEIDKTKAEKTRLSDEAEFLRSFVTVAQNNEKKFRAVLLDIQQAEKAHAAALVAAAAAEAKK
ncbi:MAG: hypothetical protein HOH58_05465 [Opitutaceae bacterium]|jgi:chromosome segregation ATPase|nr:hypothetical protein [Opitutaceae bacterium]